MEPGYGTSSRIAKGLTWFAASTGIPGVAVLGGAIALKLLSVPLSEAEFVSMIVAGSVLLSLNLPAFTIGAGQQVKIDVARLDYDAKIRAADAARAGRAGPSQTPDDE